MRKFIVIGLFLLTSIVYSQDYSIETSERENIDGTTTITRCIRLFAPRTSTSGGTTSLTIYNTVTGSRVENYFFHGYAGNNWRFYEGVVFNVDGELFTIPTRNTRDTTRGSVSEICLIPISTEFATAIKNATSIRYQMAATRFSDSINTLPEGAVEAIKNLLR